MFLLAAPLNMDAPREQGNMRYLCVLRSYLSSQLGMVRLVEYPGLNLPPPPPASRYPGMLITIIIPHQARKSTPRVPDVHMHNSGRRT